jgi:YD repeat-containing protein
MTKAHDNVSGRTETVRDRLGKETIYVYDDNGWVTLEKNALGHEKKYDYDVNGSLLSSIDPLNRETKYTVDARGNELTAQAYSNAIWQRLQNADSIEGADAVRRELVDLQKEIAAGLWDHFL